MTGERIALLILLMLLCPANAWAAQGVGQMGASISDPYKMSEFEAKSWCAQYPDAEKCKALEERWLKEKRQQIPSAKISDDKLIHYE